MRTFALNTKTISLGSDTSTTLASLRGRLSVMHLVPIQSELQPLRTLPATCGITQNDPSDEIIFSRSVRAVGLETALWLASKFNWATERP